MLLLDGSVRAYTYKESDSQAELEQDDKMHEDLGVGTAWLPPPSSVICFRFLSFP